MTTRDSIEDDVPVPCCMGSAAIGPEGCTCWKAEFDQEQQPTKAGPPRVRSTMCHDCAFRHDSPERRGVEGYDHTGEEGLAEVVAGTFFCHQGLRRHVADVHPSGARVEAPAGDYMPPGMGREGYAVRADGCPADLCAGWWAARQRAAATERERPRSLPLLGRSKPAPVREHMAAAVGLAHKSRFTILQMASALERVIDRGGTLDEAVAVVEHVMCLGPTTDIAADVLGWLQMHERAIAFQPPAILRRRCTHPPVLFGPCVPVERNSAAALERGWTSLDHNPWPDLLKEIEQDPERFGMRRKECP